MSSVEHSTGVKSYLRTAVLFLDPVVVDGDVLLLHRSGALAGGPVAGDPPGVRLLHSHGQHEVRSRLLTQHRPEACHQEEGLQGDAGDSEALDNSKGALLCRVLT